MVAMTTTIRGERAATFLNSAASPSSGDAVLKLRQLKEVILHRDPTLLPQFVPRVVELQADKASPVRKFVAEMVGDIGLKHVKYLPEMIPCLLSFLKDETPAVVRQAISTGTYVFRRVLEKLVIEGLYSTEIEDSVKSSWELMLNFKSAVLSIAFQPSRNEGVRLLAIKFVEIMVLLYTADPNISSDAPQETGDVLEFNISWLKGGHPLLNVRELAMEATQSLGSLLEQLRFPQVKSLSSSMIIVLVNSLSAIGQKRPSFYGRILPALLCLDPGSSIIKGGQIPGAFHALKTAFTTCLQCTHPSAEPWRARLLEALKSINTGELADQTSPNKISGGPSINAEALPQKEASTDQSQKRNMVEETNDVQEDAQSSKRFRLSPPIVEEDIKEKINKPSLDSVQNGSPSISPVATRDGNSEAVNQLVAMFGALAAQGDKAAGSLEILSSSISTDLLAGVVMANMQHLPPTCPRADGDVQHVQGTLQSSGSVGDNPATMQPQVLTSAIHLLLVSFPQLALFLKDIHQNDEAKNLFAGDSTPVPSTIVTDNVPVSASAPVSISTAHSIKETEASTVSLDLENVENKIPGLDSASVFSEVQESSEASHTSTSELQENQDYSTILMGRLPADVSSASYTAPLPLESQSPSFLVPEANQAPSSVSVVSSQFVLPKMSVVNINLSDEVKDHLQKEAFMRVLQADNQVAPAGSAPRLPLLAHLAIEFPLELDPWELLQKHVLSDYLNCEGHELTLRVLYRLYREAEQDQDFLSSRTATSVYEAFLLSVAESLRDTFPASDKSLGRLLVEVPYLSDGILKLLEGLCCPQSKERQDKDFQSGDRITQGLSAVWNLIMLRPSNRDRCLQIALQSAVHPLEDVRMKAIRLVANKLFPMTNISQKIEDYANEKLRSVLEINPVMDRAGVDVSGTGLRQSGDLEKSSNGGTGHTSDDQLAQRKSSPIAEAQCSMSLYFALCTKKHSLLQQVFAIYGSIPEAAKQAVHRHIPILIRTIGSSSDLLAIISDPPAGSDTLLMQVLRTLTDGTTPSYDLISSIKKLYSKTKDVEFLIPILGCLPKDEIHPIFPNIVNLPLDRFQLALSQILQGLPHVSPCLSPSEVLIAIHGIDPEKDGVPLKKIMDACSACFEQRSVFTQQVLAKVLNQLVEQIPLPLLFMRTVIQAIGVFPALVDFVMEIMSRLVSKQIWKYPKLWVGFLKCAIQTKPQSYNVLLQLPAPQLENALNKNPVLKNPLAEHASQPNIRSTLPRSTLVVLGLVQDSQTPGPPHTTTTTSQTQAADTTSSAPDAATEVTQETTATS